MTRLKSCCAAQPHERQLVGHHLQQPRQPLRLRHRSPHPPPAGPSGEADSSDSDFPSVRDAAPSPAARAVSPATLRDLFGSDDEQSAPPSP
eukprot:524425-Pleurochrysis_carterae.AAC.1